MSDQEMKTNTYILSSDTQAFNGTTPSISSPPLNGTATPSSSAPVERYIWLLFLLVILVVIVGLVGCCCWCSKKDRQRQKSGKGSAAANGAGLFYISDSALTAGSPGVGYENQATEFSRL